jgi:cytochrome c oxidase assembly protein subunit 15
MSPGMRDRAILSLSTYRWFAYGALLTLVLIVFSGAAVRLTGSGLGCPSWPDCSGTFVPELDTHVWIEYGNRLFSTVVGAACLAAGLMAYQVRPRRPDLLRPATVVAAGVVAQGLLGGLTVALHLTWQVVIAHYLLSLVLLTGAALLVWRLHHPPGSKRAGERLSVLATRVLVLYGAIVIVAGTFATAAGPHAGGAGTGDVVERLDAFGASTLRTLIHLHGHMATAMGIVAVALWVLARWRGAAPTLMRALTAVCALIAVQGIVGLVQYHNALPAEWVWVHASLPATLWTVLVWAWLAAGRVAPASGSPVLSRDEVAVSERARPRSRVVATKLSLGDKFGHQ